MVFTDSAIYVYKNWQHPGHCLLSIMFPPPYTHTLKHHLLLFKFNGSHKFLKIPCSILTLQAWLSSVWITCAPQLRESRGIVMANTLTAFGRTRAGRS